MVILLGPQPCWRALTAKRRGLGSPQRCPGVVGSPWVFQAVGTTPFARWSPPSTGIRSCSTLARRIRHCPLRRRSSCLSLSHRRSSWCLLSCSPASDLARACSLRGGWVGWSLPATALAVVIATTADHIAGGGFPHPRYLLIFIPIGSCIVAGAVCTIAVEQTCTALRPWAGTGHRLRSGDVRAPGCGAGCFRRTVPT